MTTVVNIKDDICDVYIGRGCSRYPRSKWCNTFHIGPDGSRPEVIAKYRQKVLKSPELMAALRELKGKTLGCHCAPLACHGDVLVELADALP